MIDSQHGVGLAAAKCSLKLDDRLTALTGQSLSDLSEQQTHSFGDEGAVEEGNSILVLPARLAGMDGGDVSRKLRLLERSLKNVPVRNRNLSPGFHRFLLS